MDEESVDEDELAAWFTIPVQERVVDVIGHVMLNLRDLPVFACDRSVLRVGNTWFPAYVACVEAFFINARLATEFLVRTPDQDFNAKLFVPDWSPPPAAAKRLQRVWRMTSRHIVHLGKDRTPTNPDQWESEDLSFGALMRISRDAHNTLGKLVDAADALESPYSSQLREMHQGSRPISAREAAKLHGAERKRARMATRYELRDPFAAVWWEH